MKKLVLFITILMIGTMSSSQLIADDENSQKDWKSIFEDALEAGKPLDTTSETDQPAGLGYTPSEAAALKDALTVALADGNNDRACECMKISINDYGYNSYLVIKTIYEVGGDLEVDQLCLCATESGVTKAVHAEAAGDATTSTGGKMYSRDEITQSNCFRGLAFQEEPVGDSIPVDDDDGGNDVSTFTTS